MNKKVFTCAHRGASGTHPENTIPAFEQAISLGCEMIEFDVRATADGELVILHDPTVDRTTDGKGTVWELSFLHVRSLNASDGHSDFEGVQIPTLSEVLDFIPQSIELNIHVYPGPTDGDAVVTEVCGEIRVRERYESSFIAGSEEVMNLVIRQDSKVRRCLLGSQDRPDEYARLAHKLGCTNSQPTNRITTRQFCDEAHRLGLTVHPFYADDEAEMARLIECGVDGILTNHPERLKLLLKEV